MQKPYFQYLREISQIPLLKLEEERALLGKIAVGDKSALNQLVSANLRFVVQVANFYKGRGLELNELVNEGNLGLMQAAVKFDASQKIKFLSYAVFWVRQNIIKAINEKGRIIRISAEKELMLRCYRKKGGEAKQAVGGELVIDPKSLEGCSRYNAQEIEKILQMDLKYASLDSSIGEEGENTLMNITADESAEEPHALFINECKKELLNKMLDHYLVPIEKRVLYLYFGFDGAGTKNLKDIAGMVNLPKRIVSQIKVSAMEKLKNSSELQNIFKSSAPPSSHI
jgi:RNA polymerase primary sigma factor